MKRKFLAVSEGNDWICEADSLEELAEELEREDINADTSTYYYAQPIEVEAKTILTSKTILEIQ